jgi:hypothetical protein
VWEINEAFASLNAISMLGIDPSETKPTLIIGDYRALAG